MNASRNQKIILSDLLYIINHYLSYRYLILNLVLGFTLVKVHFHKASLYERDNKNKHILP